MSAVTGGSKRIIIKAGETWVYDDELATHMLVLEDATVNITTDTYLQSDGTTEAPNTYINTITLSQGLVLPVDAASVEVLTGTVMVWW